MLHLHLKESHVASQRMSCARDGSCYIAHISFDICSKCLIISLFSVGFKIIIDKFRHKCCTEWIFFRPNYLLSFVVPSSNIDKKLNIIKPLHSLKIRKQNSLLFIIYQTKKINENNLGKILDNTKKVMSDLFDVDFNE